jgi:hypothetical protein
MRRIILIDKRGTFFVGTAEAVANEELISAIKNVPYRRSLPGERRHVQQPASN